MPETFLPASYPFCLAVSVFFTLCVSTIRKLVVELSPCLARASPTDFLGPAPERSCRPDQALTTWRSTNAPCATLEIRQAASSIANPFLANTTPRKTPRTSLLSEAWYDGERPPAKDEPAQIAPGSHCCHTPCDPSNKSQAKTTRSLVTRS